MYMCGGEMTKLSTYVSNKVTINCLYTQTYSHIRQHLNKFEVKIV